MSNTLADAGQYLVDVLTQENDALKRLDYASAVALVPAKEAALAELAALPRAAVLPPVLTPLGQQLRALAADNQVLLERAITVQTRIIQIIAKACAPPPAMRQYGDPNRRVPSQRANALALSTRA